MLKEARIILPDGGSRQHEAHNHLRSQLTEVFGGYTSFAGEGGWKTPDGKIENEMVVIYDIAIEADRDATWDKLAIIAMDAARMIDQQAVYVRYPNGGVDIIDLEKEDAKCGTSHLSDEAGDVHDVPARPGGPPAYKTDRIVQTEVGPGVTRVDHEPRPLGVKRLPQKGELWDTRAGARVAVLSHASILDGGFNVAILDRKNSSLAVQPGFTYVVNLDGNHIRGSDGPHPLDLAKFAGRFDA